MAPLTPKGDLAAAEIAFFAPAFIVSVLVVVRHGLSRQLGWFYLVTLSILRIVGASCLLYSETQHDYSQALLETAAITSAVGTAPLLLALMGFVERVHDGMQPHGLSQMIFRPIHLLAIGSLAIAIVGGVYESESTQGSQYTTGHDLMEAASILFLVIWIALVVITIITWSRRRYALAGEEKLIYAGLASLPFLLVRMCYTITVAFSNPGGKFFFRDVIVWGSAFMQFLMEAIVVVIFVTAGLMIPRRKIEKAPARSGNYKYDPVDPATELETGRPQPQYQSPPAPRRQQREPRNLGDYRPSKMLRNALGGR